MPHYKSSGKKSNRQSQVQADKDKPPSHSIPVENKRPANEIFQQLQAGVANSPRVIQQQKDINQSLRNETGMSDVLKAGVENLSGMDLSEVRVHYNSAQPAQLQALAFARGNQIHIAPGEEKHLPHEAWHVVQQKQGRVQRTGDVSGKSVNDDPALEREANVMGARSIQHAATGHSVRASTTARGITSGTHIAQLIPDKNSLYWDRLRQVAGNPPMGTTLSQHLIQYILNPANVGSVGQNVVNAVQLAVNNAAPAVLGLLQLRGAVNNGLAVNIAAPGQYAADTAHNALLTQALIANPFIQSVMDGSLHDNVPGWRNVVPAGGGSIPAPAAGTDDRVLETVDLFNRLTNLTNIPGAQLPPVAVNHIWGPHAAMGAAGQMDLGWAAARGNILHEFGHHLENNLGPSDFVTLHNFLTARTRVPAGGMGPGPMAGMRDAGYFFEHHPGYDIDMPQINAGGLAGRRTPRRWWQHIENFVTTPFTALSQGVGRAWHATPLRYLGLIGSGLKQQLGRLLSVISRRRELRNWGGNGVENFFVYNANNTQLSYSTANHNFNTAWYNGSTEYLSTTVEFFNRPSHARELVRVDPLRVALFLYLANRPQYNLVRAAFNANPGVPDLNNLIHTV